ncbi:zinc dependent phospholipase C family protein [Paenibacillus sp. CN-4]|uniref:zinc dependent phospholipase C family protein n=1 Tax=Paenibacillus nanchangensis TaxID=3348343 RepID=UPI0039790AA3
MPNLWMHIEYGRETAETFGGAMPFAEALRTHAPLFRLGCQGPDFLLYRRFWPWLGDDGSVALGNLMHTEQCGPVMMTFWERTLELPPEERTPAQVYFFGFLTHHLLDRNFHPYVNWRAGYKGRDHQRFEIMLDTVFMKRKKGFETWRHPAWRQIYAGERLPEIIVRILESAKRWYPESASLSASCWQKSYRDMVSAQRLLYDPSGWKNRLTFGLAARLLSRPLNPMEERLDFLNEAHEEWCHSADPAEKSTASVWDLWEQAMEDARLVLPALADWLKAGAGQTAALRERFRRVLGNRSYDTGKNCELALENKYSRPIWSAGV